MSTNAVSPLRQRMIEDMSARKLNPHTQRSHISSCKRFAAYLKRSPDTATADEIRLFQLHLIETGASICNRNRIMTGLRFLFRVTLRRLDLAAEIYHIKEPQKIPLVMSPDEAKRLLAMAGNLKVHVLLALGYGAGLRAGEVVRLRVGDIDSAQNIIRIVQAKGRKDRHVMLSPETLDLLRHWWKVRPNSLRYGRAARAALVVPGGGLSEDGTRWIACRPNFFLAVRVLSRLFRRLVLQMLIAAHEAGRLQFFGAHAALADTNAFAAFLVPLRRSEWVVYSKKPFGGPEAVLAYLARYTHRVAISNRRLIAADAMDITFKYKDYRIQGPERYKLMTLATDEFIRRFLMHILPKGFHRIRHSGLLANGSRADNVAKARALLNVPKPDAIPDDPKSADAAEPPTLSRPCPCCGGRMLIIETFARGCEPRYRPATAPLVIRIDTS